MRESTCFGAIIDTSSGLERSHYWAVKSIFNTVKMFTLVATVYKGITSW